MAPQVRTVVEVNNPKHVTHFKRAEVDEVLVTSKLASRLLARTALYPGLGDLVTDMVSGGEGAELYRVKVPDRMIGMSVGEVSRKLKDENDATLLALARDNGITTNPGSAVLLAEGDEVVVIAEHLEKLASLCRGARGRSRLVASGRSDKRQPAPRSPRRRAPRFVRSASGRSRS